MDTVKCPDCGAEVSIKATRCEYCGHELQHNDKIVIKRHYASLMIIYAISCIITSVVFSIGLLIAYFLVPESLSERLLNGYIPLGLLCAVGVIFLIIGVIRKNKI